jgi:hypothetical protein
LLFPAPFWRWWAEQQRAGADELLLRCDDGEAGRFSAIAVPASERDGGAAAARNAYLQSVAVEILKRTRGQRSDELARRLLARGVYHVDLPPDPLRVALFEPLGRFAIDRSYITLRPEPSPALLRLFAHRFQEPLEWEDAFLQQAIGLALPEAGTEDEDEAEEPEPPKRPAERLYRLKVALAWNKRVWRMIEILDSQTLEDLHLAIQAAFEWDNDHLYSFYLSGQFSDPLTEVEGVFNQDAEWPQTDEVTLADLEPQPGQRIAYLFDYGDQLKHEIEVLGSLPAPAAGDFPRIVESRGEAPPQYATWDEDEEGG